MGPETRQVGPCGRAWFRGNRQRPTYKIRGEAPPLVLPHIVLAEVQHGIKARDVHGRVAIMKKLAT